MSIFTSTGFQNLSVADYRTAVSTLKPDIAVPLSDLTNAPTTPNSKRAVRMADRTEEWLQAWFAGRGKAGLEETAVFAPTLPIPYALQWEYLTRLAEPEMLGYLDGLAMYDADVLPDLANHAELVGLARLSLDPPTSPLGVLRQISLGADVLTLPLVNAASDSGIALTFSFPPTEQDQESDLLPLGVDLSSDIHATSLSPLKQGCECYACTSHSAAYINHLLAAREMLGWTLLQIHNHCVLSGFFAGVRSTLQSGTFQEQVERFSRVYEDDIPAGTGERPRARGYHFKSEGGDAKRNRKGWDRGFGEGEDKKTGSKDKVEEIQIGEVEAVRLEKGLTDTPVVLEEIEGGAKELREHGFGEEAKKD